MKGALVVSWTTPKVGYEQRAVDYAREVDEVWGKYAADGRCSEPEWYWSSHRSLWIVKGDFAELQVLMMETMPLQLKGRILIEDFEYELAMYGREENLTPYEHVVAETLG
jgi:hypothetical protein